MTSKAKIIYDELCKDFPISPSENITSCSYDDANKQDFIENSSKILNFDKVDNQCQKLTGKSNKNRSPDCLIYRESNDTLYFVEFKSGSCKYKDVRYKIIDGFTNIFHYALKKNIVKSKEEFMAINFRFCLIRRNAREVAIRDSILGALELGEETRGTEAFKDLEDIYLNKVSIIMTPEKVPDVFFSLTDGRITEINYHYLDKTVRTIVTSKI